MNLQKFTFDDVDYDLTHLQDLDLTFVQPARGDKPAIEYLVTVEFSVHCFAYEREAGDDPLLMVSDNRETRTFCFERHALSRSLPELFRTLNQREIRRTGHGNFMQISDEQQNGEVVEYELYFKPSKMQKDGVRRVRLYVQSAFVRNEAHRKYRPRPKNARKIGLFVILFNTLRSKPIKD